MSHAHLQRLGYSRARQGSMLYIDMDLKADVRQGERIKRCEASGGHETDVGAALPGLAFRL